MNVKSILILLTVIVVLSCSRDRETTIIKIISPFTCKYELIFDGGHLYASSVSEVYKSDSVTTSQQIIEKIDTVIGDPDIMQFNDLLRKIKSSPTEIDSGKHFDTYSFEVYIGDDQKRGVSKYDPDIYSMIRILRPYIDESKIECCEFFQMFDKVTDNPK